jgi:cellulose synthase/poly-beta-1,6-N-acetylglucosamine synthase-like glycosyltransferase
VSLSSAALTILALAFVIPGAAAAASVLHLLSLSVGASFYRGQRPPSMAATTRLVVLVPAHDEARLIGRCVKSLRAQTYPSELYDVVVVADNCEDDTAAAAARAGARVMVRDQPKARGKGHALRWAIGRILAQRPSIDAVVVVDADSVARADFLLTLVQPYQAGADAVQGESLLYEDGSKASALRAAAFLLVNRVRPAGQAALGRPCSLAGNGMLLSRELLLAHPWEAFTSAEDLEYSLGLCVAGVAIAFAGGAVLLSPPPPSPQAAAQQQLRWEGGKAYLARTWIPRLIYASFRQRRRSLLITALDLAVPPLGFLAAGVIAAAALGAPLVAIGWLPAWAFAPWLLALVSIPISVAVGLRAAGAPPSAYRAMAQAPLLIITKVSRIRSVLGFRADSWVRTERSDGTSAGGAAP